jgi:flagella basal body P-ring formation protein FlgA
MHEASSLPSPPQIKQMTRDDVSTISIVHAGDRVRLWKQEDFLRIEVSGVSEESGGLGTTIRVRLLHRNTDDQSIHDQFSGIVRGPSDVEMQP